MSQISFSSGCIIRHGGCNDIISRQSTIETDDRGVHRTVPPKRQLLEMAPDYIREKFGNLELCRFAVFTEPQTRMLTVKHAHWLDRDARIEGKWSVASAGLFEDLKIDGDQGRGDLLGIVIYCRPDPEHIDTYDGNARWQVLWVCDGRVIQHEYITSGMTFKPSKMDFSAWIDAQCWRRQREVQKAMQANEHQINPEARRDASERRITRRLQPLIGGLVFDPSTRTGYLSQQELYAKDISESASDHQPSTLNHQR